MITPQDIRQKTFEKAVFGGYDMASVDDFMDQIIVDYTAMNKENNTLKSKMKVLVETIEEYRRQQEAAKKELAEAKTASARLLAETEARCAELKKTAEAEAVASVSRIRAEMAAEEDRLTRARLLTVNYIDRMKQVSQQHIANLDDLAAIDLSQTTAVRQAGKSPEPKAEPAVKAEPPVKVDAPMKVEAPIKTEAPVKTETPVKAEPPAKSDDLDGDTRVMDFKPEDLPPLPGEANAPASADDFEPPHEVDGIFADILRAATGERKEETQAPQKTTKFEFINLQFGKDYDVKQ